MYIAFYCTKTNENEQKLTTYTKYLPLPNFVKNYKRSYRIVYKIKDYEYADDNKVNKAILKLQKYCVLREENIVDVIVIKDSKDLKDFEKIHKEEYTIKEIFDTMKNEFKTKLLRAEKAVDAYLYAQSNKLSLCEIKKGLLLKIVNLYMYNLAILNLHTKKNAKFLIRTFYKAIYAERCDNKAEIQKELLKIVLENAKNCRKDYLNKKKLQMRIKRASSK